jgi:hypothetical protein
MVQFYLRLPLHAGRRDESLPRGDGADPPVAVQLFVDGEVKKSKKTRFLWPGLFAFTVSSDLAQETLHLDKSGTI